MLIIYSYLFIEIYNITNDNIIRTHRVILVLIFVLRGWKRFKRSTVFNRVKSKSKV